MKVRVICVLFLVFGAFSVTPPAVGSLGDYYHHDLDNMQRAVQRPYPYAGDELLSMERISTGVDQWTDATTGQLEDLPDGRVYGGLSRLLPAYLTGGQGLGDTVVVTPLRLLDRTGAALGARLFSDGASGPHPLVVIIGGSLQFPQTSYWWAAQLLAARGYLVLTWDVQGQGESETFGHRADGTVTADGFPFQQIDNFISSGVEAIRFLLSSPGHHHAPAGWSVEAADSAYVKAGSPPYNPLFADADTSAIGIVGHSYGAEAASVIAQCSDMGERWREIDVCQPDGPWPIRAVVGWDGLVVSEEVVPVVPGMDQKADGYFMFPEPAPTPPDADENLAVQRAYAAAGISSYSFTVRAGTHCEWSLLPIPHAATRYGIVSAGFYTVAWLDAFVRDDEVVQAEAVVQLVSGPVPDGSGLEFAWRANFFSVRRRSAYAFVDPISGLTHIASDIRAAAGLSPVGDWAGASEDDPKLRHA